MDTASNHGKKRLINIIRTVIAVALILFPLINFLLEIPAIVDLLGRDNSDSSQIETTNGAINNE